MLVVEDDPRMRRVLELLLSDQWDVQAVEDGRAALRAARARPPDLAVVDLLIPHLDGLALLRELRADARTRQVPVIMISGVAEEEPRILALEAGAKDFLVKPFSERELILKMRAQLESASRRAAQAADDDRRVQQRDRLLRAVLDQVSDVAAYVKDREGRYLVINAPGARYLGRPAAEVEGRRDREMMDAESAARAESMDREILRTGQSRDYVVDYGVPGQGLHTFLVTKAPYRGEDGSIQGVVGVARDITEIKQAERERERLLGSEKVARELAQKTGGRAAFLAEAGRILASTLDYEFTLASVVQLAVPSVADWCAVHLRTEDGSLQQLAVAGHDAGGVRRTAAEAADVVARLVRSGKAELHVDGPERWQLSAPLGARGHILGILSLATSDSSRRYGREDLAFAQSLADHAALALDNARLYREAQEANRIKDDFLATLSHELRTPLNAILGWAHLLRTGALDADAVQRAAETIDRNARLQSQLVGDVLDVSRIAVGKLRLEVKPVELADVLEGALETLRPSARAKGIEVTTQVERAGPVPGDSDRLQQVVWNILSNAVKFTPEGGEVRIRLVRAGTQVEMEVEDTGIGIAPDFLPNVFERFRQADGSTTRRYSGLGLGLSIARYLVELHGGTLRAASPGLGRGATFTMTLPLLIGFEPGASTRTALDRPAPSIEGVRVLVVDDDPDTRELLSTVLTREGARVDTASSVADALAAVQRQRPDVLLADIEMPDQSGYDLIRRLREMPGDASRVPAAALTAYARSQDRLEALRAGFHFHMAKPVDPRELVTVVASLAEREG